MRAVASATARATGARFASRSGAARPPSVNSKSERAGDARRRVAKVTCALTPDRGRMLLARRPRGIVLDDR